MTFFIYKKDNDKKRDPWKTSSLMAHIQPSFRKFHFKKMINLVQSKDWLTG
jgi:hypothetical protein